MPDTARFAFDGKRYPTHPGCYLMKDAAGNVIYVGKAKNLRRRLASYFQSGRKRRRIRSLVARIRDIEVILLNNETECLVLENNLIKEYQPRFNILLTPEDSGYPYIVLTREAFPRFLPYRKHRLNKALGRISENDLARRFGPYLSRHVRDVLLEFVNARYQIRTCTPLPRRACLLYHLGKCSAPCEQKILIADYDRAVKQAVALLSYGHYAVIRQMKHQMRECATRLEFEKAQRIKEQIEVLENALAKQIVERDVAYDQDVIYFGEDHALVAHIRHGILKQLRLHALNLSGDHAAACEQFLIEHYARNGPDEIILNRLANPANSQAALATANGRPIKVTLPKRGLKRELLNLTELNYAYRAACTTVDHVRPCS